MSSKTAWPPDWDGPTTKPYPVIIAEVDGSLVADSLGPPHPDTGVAPRRGFEHLIPFQPHVGDLLSWDGKRWQIARYKGIRYPVEPPAEIGLTYGQTGGES